MSNVSAELRGLFAPRRDDPHGPLPPLLLVLTFTTGLIDAVSLLVLGTIFVANMTGNVVFLGLSLVGVTTFVWWAALIALIAFVLGALVGGGIALRHGHHRALHLRTGMIFEVGLVAIAMVLAYIDPPFDVIWIRIVAIVVLALAMGIQNAIARSLAVPDLTTTVLTLTLTGAFADGTAGIGAHLVRRLLIVLTMFAGAATGAALILIAHHGLALTTATALLAVVLLVAVRHSRSTADWTRGQGRDRRATPGRPRRCAS